MPVIGAKAKRGVVIREKEGEEVGAE